MPDSAYLNASRSYGFGSYNQGNVNKWTQSHIEANKLFCNYCKKSGHVIDKCFKLHDFPADFKFTKPKRMAAQTEITSSEHSRVTSSQNMPNQAHTLGPGNAGLNAGHS